MHLIFRRCAAPESFQAPSRHRKDVFENGLSILDANFKIAAEDQINIKYGNYPAEYVKNNKRDMPGSLVSELKFNEQYQEIQKKKECFYYEEDILPHRCLYKKNL